MKHYRKLPTILLGVILLIPFIHIHGVVVAQQAFSSAGNTATGNGGTAGYTLGQVFYDTKTGNAGSVEEGVQHAYSVQAITGIENSEIELSCSVFPNPVKINLTLKVDNQETGDMSYMLYDLSGNILDMKKLVSKETGISLDEYASEVYFLKVIKGERDVKVFKIIKN